jgi:DNA replication protein DnaC
MLRAEEIEVQFDGKAALDGASLEVGDGEVVTVLGPSGSGKTTLLRVVSGLLPPETGRVLLDGVDLAGVPPHRRDIGLVFQDHALFPHRDVFGNVAFGLPGVGKSHALCAVGHALIEAGHRVLFTPAYALVQELLSAKRDLQLPRALHKLDLFEVILLDDLGYVQQSPDEAEVLFTLLAERYERRSVMVTSNLVFSQWDRIFRDQMATAAAIDRLVHHAVILEFDVPSYRTDRSRPTPPAPGPPPPGRRRPPGPLVPKRRR